MNRLLLFLSLIPFLVNAQEGHIVIQTEVHCFLYKSAIESIKNKYGEEPIFVGKSSMDSGTVTMMLVNQETGSYTILTTDRRIACLLDLGDQVIYRIPRDLQNKIK